MQVDSPFGRIFHWMKKRGRNPKSAPKGAKPRAGQSGTIRNVSKSPLAAPAVWEHFARAKTQRTCFASLPPKSRRRQKRKTTQNWVAALEQVTSETSKTFPSPLLLPLSYGQHFAGAKTEGTCFASLPKIPWAAKKKNHPIGWFLTGAGYEARTRYLHLGKVALYQMS